MNNSLNILFISRASLFTVRGGDSIQVLKTAETLQKSGVSIDIKLCNEKITDYSKYDLIHFFNITHPADMMLHIKKSNLPYVVSTIYVDYANPRTRKSKGLRDHILNLFNSNAQEYIKTMGKSILKGEKIISANYIWMGHKRSVKWVLQNASIILPNSESEYKRLFSAYGIEKKYFVIPNGADVETFNYKTEDISLKDRNMVLCVARIEQRKNQLNLIKALNNTPFQVFLLGNPAPNHISYYNECKKISGPNIHFIKAIPQEELAKYYTQAKVHVLPSWFETTGLSSLEALYSGCNIVLTKYGDTKDYFDPKYCFYCDPASVSSIREAVKKAADADLNTEYIDTVRLKYNWKKAAEKTLIAYRQLTLNTAKGTVNNNQDK